MTRIYRTVGRPPYVSEAIRQRDSADAAWHSELLLIGARRHVIRRCSTAKRRCGTEVLGVRNSRGSAGDASRSE